VIFFYQPIQKRLSAEFFVLVVWCSSRVGETTTAWLAFRLQLLGYGIAIPEAASYLMIYCWIIGTGILCLRSSDTTFLYPVDQEGTARF
jgi:hypothetical protein